MSDHIAVVDDDPVTRETLRAYFEDEGFKVSQAASADDLTRLMTRHAIDLVLLDIRLPGKDGLTITRELRSHSDVGIILITGRADRLDRLVGLELGADDYIAKPFEPREVLARTTSILRRLRMTERPDHGERYFDGWELQIDKRRLLTPQGDEARLTSGEIDLLVAFVTNAGRVLSRDQLLDLTPRRRGEPFDRSVDTLVRRLRQVLEDDPKQPQRIKTVHGSGYIFTPDVSLSPTAETR